MGRVLTNSIGLAYAIEETPGVLPTSPKFIKLEPNSPNRFGASTTTVARTPISQLRERRKGTVTDEDSGVEFEGDTTMSHIEDFTEGFLYALATNGDMTFPVTALASGGGATVASLSASQATRLVKTTKVATLVQARGFKTKLNNGLRPITTNPTTSATSINLGSNTTESGLTNSRIELAGVRGLAGQAAFSWAWDAPTKRATLTAASTAVDFTTLGLTVGQSIQIGSMVSGDIGNAFENNEANDMYGSGRIRVINAATLVMDKVSEALRFSASAPTTALDFMYGKFIRTVPVNDAAYLERSYAIEMLSPGLATNGDDMSELAIGNYCDTLSINLPLSDKSTTSFGLEGMTTSQPSTTRPTNAASALEPLSTAAFNTSADLARLRIEDLDEGGITTDFKSVTLTIANNVSGEKKLGKLGPAYMNVGILTIDLETQVIFTDPAVVKAIRCNTTVTMDFALANDDGGIIVDIPNMTLSGGEREYPTNESVLLSTTGMAFADTASDLPYSMSVSMFAHLAKAHNC